MGKSQMKAARLVRGRTSKALKDILEAECEERG